VAIVSGPGTLARGAQSIRLPSPRDVVFEVLNLLRAELERSSASSTRYREALPAFRGDGFQLQQVVLNLLRNSIESMRQVHDRPRAIEISCRADGSEIEAAFSDSGAGSSSENTDRLFDPLFTTRIPAWVWPAHLQAHHQCAPGRIWVEKNSGFGLTFAFALPL